MQPIDLIALDLDGTLLRGDESISDVNRAAITRALKSGIRVVLVTGRGVDTPIRVSRELGLNLPVICCHGALTKDFGANKTLLGQRFDEGEMHIVCPWHGYEYKLESGECATDKRLRLQRFAVVEREGGVYVAM